MASLLPLLKVAMDLAELVYQALRRHLGNEKEEALLRATAEKIAALWSKGTQGQRYQGRGEEVMESGIESEALGGEGDNRELRSEEDER